jgi:hypothetical protein
MTSMKEWFDPWRRWRARRFSRSRRFFFAS